MASPTSQIVFRRSRMRLCREGLIAMAHGSLRAGTAGKGTDGTSMEAWLSNEESIWHHIHFLHHRVASAGSGRGVVHCSGQASSQVVLHPPSHACRVCPPRDAWLPVPIFSHGMSLCRLDQTRPTAADRQIGFVAHGIPLSVSCSCGLGCRCPAGDSDRLGSP